MTQFYAGTTSYMPSSYQGGSKLAQQDSNQQQTAPKNPHDINISQILVDFKNTIASIGAPQDIEQKVNEYIALVEVEANKEIPRQETIITNLKTASKMLDDYISATLKKSSNVVQDWLDAFLLQKVDYKADANKADIPASKQIEAEIEQNNPQLKQNNVSAVSDYNNYQNKIHLKHKNTQQNSTGTSAKSDLQSQTPQNQEEQVQEAPKKRVRFATPDGKIVQGDQIVGEKTQDGTTKIYSPEEAAQKTFESQSEPKIVYEEALIQKNSDISVNSKKDAISNNSMIQKFYEKAKEYFNKGDSQKALESYKKTFEYAKKTNDKNSQAYIIQGIGESYDELNNLARAAKCFNKVTKMTRDMSLKATGHNSLGEVYNEAGKFNLAMDHYFESLALNGEEDNTDKQAQTLNNIGKMHTSRYMSKEAIDFYKLALTMAKQNTPDIATMGNVLNNTADAFDMLNKPQSALKYYQKSLICANKANDKETASLVYEKAADLMMNMNKPQKAKSLYKKAMQEALNMKDSEQIRNIKEKMNALTA